MSKINIDVSDAQLVIFCCISSCEEKMYIQFIYIIESILFRSLSLSYRYRYVGPNKVSVDETKLREKKINNKNTAADRVI